MAIVSASVSSENSSAITLASWPRARWLPSLAPAEAPGMTASTSAPAAGIAIVTLSQGNVLITFAASLDPHQQEGADQQHRAHEHGQGIGPDEPGLDPSDPSRCAADRRGDRID